jgi:outer membrane protein with beta-barrel domain
MTNRWRPLALAAALNVGVCVGVAAAQTVIVRRAPAGSNVEFLLNAESMGTAVVNADGDATIVAGRSGGASKSDLDANLYVDACDTVRRVIVVERSHTPPPPDSGCARSQIAGLYLVKPISTLVVDVGGPIPTVLLRQGSYSLAPPRTWATAPSGLIVFGGGAFTKFQQVANVACGTAQQCSRDESAFGYTAGVSYWFTPFLGAEGGYLKPGKPKVNGGGTGYRFNSALDADVFTAVGKVGGPIGPVRLYGEVGADYHRATLETTETIDEQTVTVDGTTQTIRGGTQTLGLETSGWGLVFGGGLEVWLARRFALYGEGSYAAIKGNAREGEGSIDDHVIVLAFGVRVRIY